MNKDIIPPRSAAMLSSEIEDQQAERGHSNLEPEPNDRMARHASYFCNHAFRATRIAYSTANSGKLEAAAVRMKMVSFS